MTYGQLQTRKLQYLGHLIRHKRPFKCYVTLMEVGGVNFSGRKCYECVRFNVNSVTRGWVGVQFSGKKRYVSLEWPLTHDNYN